jgi:hypothetical protein
MRRYSYGLDGRGSIPGRDEIFASSTASAATLCPTQPHIQCSKGCFPWFEPGPPWWEAGD